MADGRGRLRGGGLALPLHGLVVTDGASGGGAKRSMMASDVARDTTDGCAGQAASLRRRHGPDGG